MQGTGWAAGAGGIRTLGDGNMRADKMKKKHELEYGQALITGEALSMAAIKTSLFSQSKYEYLTFVVH